MGELTELCELPRSVKLDPEINDSWVCGSSNGGKFTTKNLTNLINSKTICAGTNAKESLKNNFVPKKVVFLFGGLERDAYLYVWNLIKEGLISTQFVVPLCDDNIESVDHSLLSCKRVYDIWSKVYNWWGLGRLSNVNLDDLLHGKLSLQSSDASKLIWKAVLWTSCISYR
ncbi:uncharacterized protein [Rutidosis leptorrhynchoides]|uniref:uncharacterized protein n=1 Tax=Rutidosis leptorrhynchoides TaxID=125765 RepID=UPI003A9A304D